MSDIVHRTHPLPFYAMCGADVPNQRTTQIDANVTCSECLVLMALRGTGRQPRPSISLDFEDMATNDWACLVHCAQHGDVFENGGQNIVVESVIITKTGALVSGATPRGSQ